MKSIALVTAGGNKSGMAFVVVVLAESALAVCVRQQAAIAAMEQNSRSFFVFMVFFVCCGLPNRRLCIPLSDRWQVLNQAIKTIFGPGVSRSKSESPFIDARQIRSPRVKASGKASLKMTRGK